MAVQAGTAYVDIQGDFSGLNKQVSSHFNKISKQAGGTGKKIGRTLGLGMAAGVAGVAVAGKQLFDFGKDAVNVASDVSESLSKNQVLFGKYAKSVEDFSKRSADAFGISRRSALEYTGTFGNLFKALGISNKESAKFSTNLLKLAADMASFNNASPEEALDAIRAGLTGETEPLRKFGVNMNDATLKAEALRKGLIKNTKEALSPQTKALAAQSLIIKQTDAAHGDFAKTSDGLANSQRRLKARWEDMKGTLGDALLPAVTEVSGALLDIADKVQPKVQDAINKIIKIFGSDDLSFGQKIQRSWDAIKLEFGPMARDLVQGFKDLNLDDKLAGAVRAATPKVTAVFKDVGIAAAKAVWAGFQAAPLWAKVGGGLWLARKLGISGAMFKGLTSALSGRGAGGAGTLAMPGGTPARPMFVIVENWAKIAAGSIAGGSAIVGGAAHGAARGSFDLTRGGAVSKAQSVAMRSGGGAALVSGAAGAAAATGFLAKFKGQLTKLGPKLLKGAGIGAGIAIAGDIGSSVVGQVVGGKAGEDIKKIGSRASLWGGIGATAGTLIAPGIGTAIGGAGGALLGGLSVVLSKKDTGTKVIESMNEGLKKAQQGTTLKLLSTADIEKQIADAGKRFDAAQPKVRPAGMAGPKVTVTPEDKAAAATAALDLGTAFTARFKLVIDQAQFWSPESFQKQADAITRDPSLPAAARKQAAIQMSQYAMELQRQGRLPQGAAQQIVANFEQQFGKLSFVGRRAGEGAMQALARSLRMQNVTEAIRSNITKWHGQFGGLPTLGRLTGENFTRNMTKYLGPNGFLTKQIQAGVRGSVAAYKTLAEQSGRYLRQMTGSSAAAARELSKAFGGQGAAGSIRAWREQIVTTDPVLARHEERLTTARTKLRNLKKGSEEYNEAQKKVRVEQKIINDRLLNTIDVAPRTRTQVRKLGINFSDLGGSVEEAAGLIAAATNMVLSGLGADTIKFSLKQSQRLKNHPHQRGGPIPGVGVGDKYPALLEAGEYVVNRKAVQKVGKKTLDRLNFGDAPRFQKGGIVELLHPDNDPEGHGGSNSHLHVAMSTTSGIIALGKRLQRLGWLVGENPAFGGIQGNHEPTGWHPKGLAIDVNWPDPGKELAKIRALLPSLGGVGGTGGVQAAKIPKVEVEGPAGMMRTILVNSEKEMRKAAQEFVDSQAGPVEGTEPGASTNVSGNGSGLMRKISKQRGWNFSDWWKLDEKESSHGANLANPTSSARLRGQFLDMNYGKYGPGSDPAQNPSMAQQIYSMASYIQQRYGNPTRAWAAWMSHYPPGWYQRGGIVSALAKLGVPMPMLRAGGALTGKEVASYARKAGFTGDTLVKMLAISRRESRWDPDVQNLKYPDHSIGLWQINQLAHKGRYGSDAALKNPATNARAAWQLSQHGTDLGPWKGPNGNPMWNTAEHMDAARAAAKASGSVGAKPDAKPKLSTKVFKASKKLIDGIHRVKKSKLNNIVSKRVQKRLGQIGFTEQQAKLEALQANVDTYADWAQRASDITDTNALQQGLNAELLRRGATGGMSDADLLKLFPADQQDAFISSWKHQNASYGGKIDVEWLNDEVGGLLAWRNQMINDLYTGNPTLDVMRVNAVTLWKQLHTSIRKIMKRIADHNKAKQKIIALIRTKREKLAAARKALAKEQDKNPKTKKGKEDHEKKLRSLRNDVAQYAAEEAALHHGNREDLFHLGLLKRGDRKPAFEHSLMWYNNRLRQLNKDNNARQSAATTLGGDDGTTTVPTTWGGTIGEIESAKEAVIDSLDNVHGLGSTLQPFTSSTEFALGTLGGTILSVQRQIGDLTNNPLRATAPDAISSTSEAESASKALLEQLLKDANLRTAVSQAQFDVFRDLPTTFGNYPFGGFFAEGGPVPGPVGAPRMIVAHGGEYVVPNDGNIGGAHVSIHVASGMEWLKQFIDVRVEGQTRAQSRRGERQLPGRAGLLTR